MALSLVILSILLIFAAIGIWRRENWVRGLVLLRAPLGIAAALVAVPILAARGGDNALAALASNLFSLRSPFEVYWVSLLAILTAWQCAFAALLIWEYAPHRMPDLKLPMSRWWRRQRVLRIFIFSWIAFPLLAIVAQETESDVNPWPPMGLALSTGVGVFLVIGGVRRFFLNNLEDFLARVLGQALFSRLPQAISAGYIRPDEEHPQSQRQVLYFGHATATASLIVLAAMYIAGALLLRPDAPLLMQFPALAYFLMLMLLLASILPGVTFFFDRFSIPLFAVIAVWTFVMYSITPGYTFRVQPEVAAPGVLPSIEETVEPWLAKEESEESESKPALVVVCASGGGIQATAWTTRVLTWLHEAPELHQKFYPAIRFVSASSGGSLGVLYFMEGLDPSAPPGDSSLERIRTAGSRSSLSETGWGLVYPDFQRTVFPFFINERVDRAWAMEEAWRRGLDPAGENHPPIDTKLSQWAQDARNGTKPGIVLNSFVIETGQRFLISNVDLPRARQARSFWRLYGRSQTPASAGTQMQVDMDVITAARLSATFPYVTPISHAAWDDAESGPYPLSSVHMGDGSYFDNGGVLAGIEWIESLLNLPAKNGKTYGDRLGKIVILEIRAFGFENLSDPACQLPPERWGDKHAKPEHGWLYAVAGPAIGLLRTRNSSQIARNDTEICQLKGRYPGLIEHIVFQPEQVFSLLSWHLTQAHVDQLDTERERILSSYEVRQLSRWLNDGS